MVDLAGTAPASCNRFLSGVKLQFLVPKEGVEPSCLSTVDFESTAYAIPPLGHYFWCSRVESNYQRILTMDMLCHLTTRAF